MPSIHPYPNITNFDKVSLMFHKFLQVFRQLASSFGSSILSTYSYAPRRNILYSLGSTCLDKSHSTNTTSVTWMNFKNTNTRTEWIDDIKWKNIDVIPRTNSKYISPIPRLYLYLGLLTQVTTRNFVIELRLETLIVYIVHVSITVTNTNSWAVHNQVLLMTVMGCTTYTFKGTSVS